MSGVGLFNRVPSIEAAEKALTDAEAMLARWSAEVEAKGAELAHLQAHAGDDVLADADAAGRIAAQAVSLGAEQDVARRAVLAATSRVESARRALLEARAGQLRGRVDRLRKTAAGRQRRTDELLAALREHEGPDYVPWEPPHGYVLQHGSVTVKVPLTGVIAGWADALERQAAELERVAGQGSADEVAGAVGRPVPEVSGLEREHAGARA